MTRLFPFRRPLPSILIPIFAGLLLGALCIFISSLWVVFGLGLLFIAIYLIKNQEYSLLAILIVTSTIFEYYQLPMISIGVGKIGLMDIIVVFPLVVILVQYLIKPGYQLIHTHLDYPLAFFYIIALLSTVIEILQSRISFGLSLGELRMVNFLLTFFITTNVIRNERQLKIVFKGISILALIVGLAIIAQYFLGDSVRIISGRIEKFMTGTYSISDVNRILPPGQSLVLLDFITLVVFIGIEKSTFYKNASKVVQLGIIGGAILITFQRNFFVAIGIALILLIFLMPWFMKIRLFKFITPILVIALLVIYFGGLSINSSFMTAVEYRISTLFDLRTLQEGSLSFRYVETNYAIQKILEYPIIGMGMGANYRPIDVRLDSFISTNSMTSYIHNGHLWLMLKSGLSGYFFLMTFFILAIARGLKNWQKITIPYQRGIVLSFSLTLIGVLLAAIVNPIFEQPYWPSLLGIMIGINELIIRLNTGQTVETNKK